MLFRFQQSVAPDVCLSSLTGITGVVRRAANGCLFGASCLCLLLSSGLLGGAAAGEDPGKRGVETSRQAEPSAAGNSDATLSSSESAEATEDDSLAEIQFVRHVLPVLKARCFGCHGEAEDRRGGLDLRSQAGLLAGGESGEPAIIAGKPLQSPLYQAVQRQSAFVSPMPPKENDALSSSEVAVIHDWIAAGTIWPPEARITAIRKAYQAEWDAAAGVAVATSGGLSEDWTNRRYPAEQLWAYRPLWSGATELLADASQNPVDVLIERSLAERGLTPAPRADRRTLLRRVTYDLTGLPPTVEELAAFLSDSADDQTAFASVVERLLASPHYGEQWGRHWLDVVRYADSSGFANDYERGTAWRYRDYVVRAFNEDKPYDQFILEQLAGDELDPSDPELLIATGFLRMGPWELTSMEVAKVARQRFLDDVTDQVGQVFLGHMLQCARCHDHKFDPVPTRDYYAIQAVFATTQLVDRPAPFLDSENLQGFDEQRYLELRRQHDQQTLTELAERQTLTAVREWYRETGHPATHFEQVVQDLLQQQETGTEPTVAAVRREMQAREVDPELIPPRHVGFEPRDFGLERVARKGLERLRWRADRYQPIAMSVYNGPSNLGRSVTSPLRLPSQPAAVGDPESTCILTGGDPFSPAEPVVPGVLSAVSLWEEPTEGTASSTENSPSQGARLDTRTRSALSPDSHGWQRRTEFAHWVADPRNPLTSRVLANRVWQWHFGKALAGNPNNFGATGAAPTHPELIDTLATALIQQGGAIKQLNRLILLSDAYARSTQHPDPQQLEELDPLRTAYAVRLPRRLAAEELRDSLLAVTGELNRSIGGIPCRPEMHPDAALQPRQVMGTFAEAWQPAPLPEQRHRRSLYMLRIRGQGDPFLDVFNAPNSEVSCEARETSTVTPQVFAMLNNQQVLTRSFVLADNLLQAAHAANPSNAEPIERRQVVRQLFQRLFGRTPSDAELQLCLNHWERMQQRHQDLEIPPIVQPLEVIREAVEENTGELFTFTEPLEMLRDFVPDIHPERLSAETRGLAELCLVLLNSNEYLHLY